MVARLLRLRVALLLAPLRRGVQQTLIAVALRLIYIAAAVGFALAPVLLAQGNLEMLAQYDILFGTMMLVGVTLFPLCIASLHLDSRAFVQFPYTATKLTLGLLATAWATWSGIAAIAWLVTFVVTRWAVLPLTLTSVLSLIAITVSMPVFSRVAGTFRSLADQSSRTQSIQRGIGALLLVAALPVHGLIMVTTIRSETQLLETAKAFGWTPFGASFATISPSTETLGSVSVQLGAHIACIALLVAAQISLTNIVMERIDFPTPGAMQQNSLGWFDLLPHTPSMTIGARSLTYWLKDPRYLVSLVAIPIIPVLIIGVLLLAGVDAQHLAVIPLIIILTMLGWMIHNDLATDSTAMWIHVASGIRGIQDRVGRMIPVLIFGIPVLVIGTSITVIVMRNWQAFPAVFALGATALCVSTALSSIMSVLKPYPTTRPGESPFVQPSWHGSGAGVAQTTSLVGSALLIAPLVWVLLVQPEIDLQRSLMLSLVSVIYGLCILAAGLIIGGTLYNRRNSELLAFTQVFD